MYKQALSFAVALSGFVSMGTVALEPAQASLLDFSFTTINGAEGTFTLDTDTPPSLVPSLGISTPGFPGILYPNAVSNFSFRSPERPQLNVSNQVADWEVIPNIPSVETGNLSGLVFPSGCSAEAPFTCLINVGVLYTGNPSELSDNPDSYPVGLGVDSFDSTNNFASFGIEPLSDYKVVRRETVPEPNTYLGTLAVGIYGTALLLKRKRSNLAQNISESRPE